MAAATHVELLIESGHEVSIVGSFTSIINENLSFASKYFVSSDGTGSIYSAARVDSNTLENIILKENPDLVLVEGWQTALTDAAIDVSKRLGFSVMVVSHGVSLHRFSFSIIDFLKAIAWLPYRYTFCKRLSGLKLLTALDLKSNSLRFYDRMIAKKMSIPLCELGNTAVNYIESDKQPLAARKKQILIVGYFSPIKNQMGMVNVIAKLPYDIKVIFVGPRKGRYYQKCYKKIIDMELAGRVSFCQDNEINLARELSLSLAVLLLSKTEVLPLTLLEAMASGTPFVASPVGAIPSLEGGLLVYDSDEASQAIVKLVQSPDLWNELSKKGLNFFNKHYSRKIIKKQLLKSINIAARSNAKK